MDWDDLKVALAVAEARSLSGGARALGVDVATVARRLERLEAALGAKLFQRDNRGLAPTSAGEKLAAHVARMEAEVHDIRTGLDAADLGLAGTVAVTTTDVLACHLVTPALGRLQAQHPGIAIEIATDIRTLNLSRREADIALRLARPEQASLLARKVGDVGYALYATKAYLKAAGEPAVGSAGHRLIDWPEDYTIIPQVPWLRRFAKDATVVLRANSAHARHQAAMAGLGLALLPCVMVGPKDGLVRIDTPEPAPSLELWLAAHQDQARVPRVRAVLDFLAETAAGEKGRLAGRA
jgi:DNA-binding transcriptional LysR family regulator